MSLTAPGVETAAFGRVGTALGDPTRRRILLRLAQGPAYPADLAAGLATTRANVSNHLARLRGWGLVTTRPQGRRVLYQLSTPHLAQALRRLASVAVALEAAERSGT